jgi:hypothetical protein
MPNPVPAKYTVQLGPTVTPEVAGELAAWAKMLGKSTSAVVRECIEAGLAASTREYTTQLRLTSGYASLPNDVLEECIAAARDRSNVQVSRRRSYDDRTRRGETAMAANVAAKRAAKRTKPAE